MAQSAVLILFFISFTNFLSVALSSIDQSGVMNNASIFFDSFEFSTVPENCINTVLAAQFHFDGSAMLLLFPANSTALSNFRLCTKWLHSSNLRSSPKWVQKLSNSISCLPLLLQTWSHSFVSRDSQLIYHSASIQCRSNFSSQSGQSMKIPWFAPSSS